MTDTGIAFGPKGEISHPGPDQVLRITRSGATIASSASSKLAGPNGITWDSKENRFVIVSFMGNGIFGWKPGDKDVKSLGTGPGQQDGRDGVAGWPDTGHQLGGLEPLRAGPWQDEQGGHRYRLACGHRLRREGLRG